MLFFFVMPSCLRSFQKWEDIVKEVKFLSQLKHENTIGFRGCFLKDSTCWVISYDLHIVSYTSIYIRLCVVLFFKLLNSWWWNIVLVQHQTLLKVCTTNQIHVVLSYVIHVSYTDESDCSTSFWCCSLCKSYHIHTSIIVICTCTCVWAICAYVCTITEFDVYLGHFLSNVWLHSW